MKKIITVFMFVFFLSCEEVINEQDITNDTLILLAPLENVALKTGVKIAFNWEVLNGASNYKLQIAEPNFSSANQIVKDTVVQRTDFSIDSLPVSLYEWRVKALNSAYETTYTTNSFAIEEP